MGAQELSRKTFRDLIETGRQVLSNSGWDGRNFKHHHPPDDEYLRFRTRAINLVRRVCGESSEHFRELRRLAEHEDSANNSYFFVHCLGAPEAAEQDFEDGLLFDIRSMIAAELLGDFLDQAETLLEAGYYVPAASLAGAVLEDTLRKLCELRGVKLPASTKIDRLNADLARAGVYNKLVQKRITALADIRNNADHGRFQEFGRDDVKDMVKSVKAFATDHLR